MARSIIYTNGVIAAKDKYLLKDKILRFCELSAEEAFRMLIESGFGGGAETAENVYEYEKLIEAEERAVDEFILEYAPSKEEQAYLLSPRDFHNAKAILKATYLKTDAEKMLAPQGEIAIEKLVAYIQNGDFSALEKEYPELKKACEDGLASLQEEEVSGAELSEIFEKAAYAYATRICKKNSTLRHLLQTKADMTNILIAFRAKEEQKAKNKYLPGGTLDEATLSKLFLDGEKAEDAFKYSVYRAFVRLCLDAKQKGLPFTAAEKIRDGYETEYFQQRRYNLKHIQPFLYYVFRRRTENANVRIVFVCLLAGLKEAEVKKRLRAAF